MSLSEIVNVQISRETRSVSRAGFGTAMILGSNANFSDRIQYFTDLASIAAAMVGGTAAAEYAAAADMLAQNPRVVRVGIGNRQGNRVLTDNAGTYTAGTITVTINGTLISQAYSTNKDDTLTALAVLIAAHAAVDTCAYSNASHTITIVPNTGYVLSVVANLGAITGTMTMVLSAVSTEDVDDALNAIKVVDNEWYGLCLTSRSSGDQLLAAAWIETERKVCILASTESAIINTTDSADTTSLAAVLKAAAYARTAVVYLGAAATEYPDAALLGKILPFDPGTYTAKFKTLASITADDLTSTQSTNARDKHANTDENIGSVNILREGTVAEGEFIDVIIFVDWLQARIQESVYGILVNNKKIPYTEAGMGAVKAAITQPLQIGQNRGGISPTAFDTDNNQIGGFYIELPAFASIPAQDKAARLLDNVIFVAWLAGAIHAVNINGTVTL